jgi:hypothetical protein
VPVRKSRALSQCIRGLPPYLRIACPGNKGLSKPDVALALRDAKRIGRELGVRYVLEGSVQRGGNRMRVNVQLIDAATGNHLWAERFDNPLADLLDMQDEIVARLANQLGTKLIAAEARTLARLRALQSDLVDPTIAVHRGRVVKRSSRWRRRI